MPVIVSAPAAADRVADREVQARGERLGEHHLVCASWRPAGRPWPTPAASGRARRRKRARRGWALTRKCPTPGRRRARSGRPSSRHSAPRAIPPPRARRVDGARPFREHMDHDHRRRDDRVRSAEPMSRSRLALRLDSVRARTSTSVAPATGHRDERDDRTSAAEVALDAAPGDPQRRRPAAHRRAGARGWRGAGVVDERAVAQEDHPVRPGGVARLVGDQDARPAGVAAGAQEPRTISPVSASSAPVGSSASTSRRGPTSARAIATRCCWPPESSSGKRSASSSRPTSSSAVDRLPAGRPRAARRRARAAARRSRRRSAPGSG